MAKKVITTTQFSDDLDGSTAAGTIAFAVNGSTYEIDLSKANTRAFEKTLKPYLDAARKVRTGRAKASGRAKANTKHDLSAVRAWAKANGHEVSDRGRIAGAIIEAYSAAK